MDYIEWCEKILTGFGRLCRADNYHREHGIDEDRLEKFVLGDDYGEVHQMMLEAEFEDIFFEAMFDLAKINLIDDINDSFSKLNRNGRAASEDLFALHKAICRTELPADVAAALRIVNRDSEICLERFAVTQDISVGGVWSEMAEANPNLSEADVVEMMQVLKNRKMVFWDGGDYPDEVRATYCGLVWDRYRARIVNADYFDRLLDDGETTSVEFKRELYLDTKDRKAEFIKDILGLVNTQASGTRLLIIGFDDKTHRYHAPPDTVISQNIIEQILAAYTVPVVEVKYEKMPYRDLGEIGVITVSRDRTKLPYRPSKSFGDKKKVREDQIFVRHGSQTEEALPSELAALEEERERAKVSPDIAA